MATGTLGYLELRLPALAWVKVKHEFDNALFQMTGRPVVTTEDAALEFEISWVHWRPIREMLEERKIPYEFLDRRIAKPTWQSWP
jgi:hypothetical protein